MKEISETLRSLGVTPPANASLSTLENLLASTEASTEASTVDTTETRQRRLREGEGEGDIPLPNGKGRGAPLKDDPDKQFWDSAKSYLSGSGVRNPGGLIGKWCRDYGQADAAKAITAAQVERAVDPVPYIEKTLRRGKAQEYELPIA